MIRWYCYQTERGREQDAAAQITDRGFRVLAIQQEYQRIIRGAVVACCRQLFPGYGFVQFDVEADPWPRINSARNGVRIVTAGGDAPRPIPIITAQMERLLEWVDETGMFCDPRSDPTRPWEALQDQPVRVIAGPFTGFNGLCSMTDSSRIAVLLTMFGQVRTVQIDYRQVEAMA